LAVLTPWPKISGNKSNKNRNTIIACFMVIYADDDGNDGDDDDDDDDCLRVVCLLFTRVI
jgi:hypothetical protein